MPDGWADAVATAGFNWIDLLVGLFLLILMWRGLRTGLIGGLFSIMTLAGALWIAMTFHGQAGDWLVEQTGLPEGLAAGVAFLALLVGSRLALGIPAGHLEVAILSSLRWFRPLIFLNRVAGVLPEVLIGSAAMLAILLLLTLVPVSRPVTEAIRASWTGRNIVPHVAHAAPLAQDVIGRLPAEPLPIGEPRIADPNERIELDFPDDIQLTPDPEAEQRMLDLLNRERASRNLEPLELDRSIVPVARAHSEDMFRRGYFAHESPEGATPFDRLRAGDVAFLIAGENLAYAPTVEQAHKGLMESPGHRANILRPEFGRIGIGVIRGGIHGTMFTQNFAN